MIVTVLTAGVQSIDRNRSLLHKPGGDPTKTLVNMILTAIMMALAVIVSADCVRKWVTILLWPKRRMPEPGPSGDLMRLTEGTEVSD
jgi:hypothetical protein